MLKNTTTIDKLEMPLKFLKQNDDRRHLGIGHEYIRHLTLALLESLVIKDKLVMNLKVGILPLVHITILPKFRTIFSGMKPQKLAGRARSPQIFFLFHSRCIFFKILWDANFQIP